MFQLSRRVTGVFDFSERAESIPRDFRPRRNVPDLVRFCQTEVAIRSNASKGDARRRTFGMCVRKTIVSLNALSTVRPCDRYDVLAQSRSIARVCEVRYHALPVPQAH